MTTKFKSLLLLLAAAGMASCDTEDDNHVSEPVKVSFQSDLQLTEGNEPGEIVLLFSKPAPSAGELSVAIQSSDNERFATDPEMENGKVILAVAAGQQQATVQITPVDDNAYSEPLEISARLDGMSEGFVKGTRETANITLTDDDGIVISFTVAGDTLMENHQGVQQVELQLSSPATVAGEIVIVHDLDDRVLQSDEDQGEGRIRLAVNPGDETVKFGLSATDDEILLGHSNFHFEIESAGDNLVIGDENRFKLLLRDDELAGKPMSWESLGGTWRVKHSYTYDESGRIKTVAWEQNTPGTTTGTRSYFYAENGLIERVNHSANSDDIYHQHNGRIVRMDEIVNGEMRSYQLFDYDGAGNVGGVAIYHRQPDGQFVNSQILIALYFTDGNLFKTLVYNPASGEEEPVLVSEKTYDDYLTVENPFPFIELVPGKNAQRNFAGFHSITDADETLEYQFEYEFDSEGKPVMRKIPGTNEVTHYSYY